MPKLCKPYAPSGKKKMRIQRIKINEEWAKIAGYILDELAPVSIKTWGMIANPDDIKQSTELLERHFSGELPFYDYECRIKHKDGHWVWVHDRGRVITRTVDGKPLMMFGTHSDITVRKRMEENLRTSEERHRLLADNALDVISVVDIDGRFTYVSPSIEKLLGYTPTEVIHQSLEDIMTPDGAAISRSWLIQTLAAVQAGSPLPDFRADFEQNCKDGSTVWTDLTTTCMKNAIGDFIGTLVVARDISERKKAEREKTKLEAQLRQSQKMESIGSLAGGIAHDLNNILFPISGLSEMLLDEIPPENPAHESIEQIYKSAQRGSDLVKQVLSFSRQSKPQKLPIRIQPVLKEVLKLSRSAIPSNIEITSHINTNCGMVSADPTQVHQIMMNLVTNAYHAVEQTGGTINVELKETVFGIDDLYDNSMTGGLLAGKYACITITDNGTGIDQTLINKIFDPYFTTKEMGKGTGLGLSVVHGIVKEHGGDIRVYSEVGKGTVFHVYLPLLEDDRDSKTSPVTRKYPMGAEKILLVDDEESIVLMVQMMLEKLGYQITARLSSPDALAAFKANPDPFDLVISDRGMPNMTGDQLAVELMSIRPDIPIILCTGFSNENEVKRAKAMGIKGFLMKPMAIGDLAEMVRKVLDDVKGTSQS